MLSLTPNEATSAPQTLNVQSFVTINVVTWIHSALDSQRAWNATNVGTVSGRRQ